MAEFTEADQALQDKLLTHGILFPPEFKEKMRGLILEGMKKMPYDQFQGAQLIQGKTVRFGGDGLSSKDTSGVYVSCVPAHKVEGLANGRYVIIYGCFLGGASAGHWYSLSVNGATPSDTEAIEGLRAIVSGGRVVEKDLTVDNNNTLELKVKGGNSSSLGVVYGWMAVLRLGSV